jgi:hypothetical protein
MGRTLPRGCPWREHQESMCASEEKNRMLAHGAIGLSHHRSGGYGKCINRSVRAVFPRSIAKSSDSASPPSEVRMFTSCCRAAPIPSEHHAQFAHQPPVAVLTQNAVGCSAKGCKLQARSEFGTRMTPWICSSRLNRSAVFCSVVRAKSDNFCNEGACPWSMTWRISR